jgi:DNA-binding PadR family transcriptional regulator
LERWDWLLLYLAYPGGKYEVDQLRAMKGMFLFTKDGPETVRNLYNFSPYNYGPFDSAIYRDLERLEEEHLIRSEPTPGSNRRIFRMTTDGIDRSQELATAVSPAAAKELQAIKNFTTNRSFMDLCDAIYERFPAFASRSLIR